MDLVGLSEFDGAIKSDLTLLIKLSLIANHINQKILVSVLSNLLELINQAHESFFSCNIIS